MLNAYDWEYIKIKELKQVQKYEKTIKITTWQTQ